MADHAPPSARRRAVLATAVVAAALGAALAPAAAAQAPPAAAGIVTLSGSRTAYVTIRLPKAAQLRQPADYGSTPFATGTGRYLGYVLSDDKPGGIRILAGVQGGGASAPYSFAIQGIADGRTYSLPAGTYRLYLLADGSPAKVTLRFDGLTGRRALAPSVRVPYTVATPTVLATPGGTLSLAGTEATLPGRGLLFDFLGDVNSQFVSSNTQLCFYDSTPPPQPVGYGPGCPGGQPANLTNTAPGVGGTKGSTFSGIADVPAGRYGLGFNRVGVAVTDSLRYTAGFLGLDAVGRTVTVKRPAARTPAGGGTAATPLDPAAGPRLPASGLPGALPVAGAVTVVAAVGLRGGHRRRTGG